MTTTSKTKKAQQLLGQLQEYDHAYEISWWGKAEALAKLKDNNLYKHVFGTDNMQEKNEKTWRTFLGEIDMLTQKGNTTTADFMVRNARYYLSEKDFEKKDLIDYKHRKLDTLRRYDPDNLDKFLEMCKPVKEGGLSHGDLKIELENQ